MRRLAWSHFKQGEFADLGQSIRDLDDQIRPANSLDLVRLSLGKDGSTQIRISISSLKGLTIYETRWEMSLYVAFH